MDNRILNDRTVVEYSMVLDKSYYKVLMSRLQNNHFAYYKDFMGLNNKYNQE